MHIFDVHAQRGRETLYPRVPRAWPVFRQLDSAARPDSVNLFSMVYELFYWPGFTGRLEPILTLLADAGIEYEISRENIFCPISIVCPIRLEQLYSLPTRWD
eukprot:COSAG02_NODE_29663_length_565_cov_0.978541_1_plen_102_part_00